MPHLLPPMLADTGIMPGKANDTVYEFKWDGFRAMAEVKEKNVFLYSRNLKSFNKTFPAIVDSLAELKINTLLDGELVALDEKGYPKFDILLERKNADQSRIYYYVFDILWHEGKSLLEMPFLNRKKILKSLIPSNSAVKYNEHFETDGKEFFEKVTNEFRLEGIIAKKKFSHYYPGKRTSEWIKYKGKFTEDVIVVGYVESGGSFSELLYGVYKGEKLFYQDRVERGFKANEKPALMRLLTKKEVKGKPVINDVTDATGVHWVKPSLVIEISHDRVLTGSGRLRHAATFRRLLPVL